MHASIGYNVPGANIRNRTHLSSFKISLSMRLGPCQRNTCHSSHIPTTPGVSSTEVDEDSSDYRKRQVVGFSRVLNIPEDLLMRM